MGEFRLDSLLVGLFRYVVIFFSVGGVLLGSEKLSPESFYHSGIFELKQSEPNLNGKGVSICLVCRSYSYIDGVARNDYRPAVDHVCFSGVDFSFHDNEDMAAGVSPHSTAIASILFGNDANAYNEDFGRFCYRGILPESKAEIYEFQHFLSNYIFEHKQPEADIISMSMGSSFDDWWTRGLESIVEDYNIIVVAGIGNGIEACDPVLYPGASANVIGVGVIDSVNSGDILKSLCNFGLAYPYHSSFGPTFDRRCKPDIVAPGNSLVAVTDNIYGYQPSGDWASFATPRVAGTIGLLLEKAGEDRSLSEGLAGGGRACVIKAILLNSAKKLAYWHKGKLGKEDDHEVPLDYIQGAGMLDAQSAYDLFVCGQQKCGQAKPKGWDNDVIDQRQEKVYRVRVDDKEQKAITVTLIWNRHYQKQYPFNAIDQADSDLRVELWAVDPNGIMEDLLVDYSDSKVDNVEHIYCQRREGYRNYEIVVSRNAAKTAAKKAERYGLAWNFGTKLLSKDDILLYDLNGDGVVDRTDVDILFENMISSGKGNNYYLGDINSDGRIDLDDVDIMIRNFGRHADWFLKH